MNEQSMTLQLDVFEGPLDLLLYLIKKNDLEISRISVSQITGQYLEYLDTLKELDIDIASEFLYMAAELTHMKSKTLLPNDGQENEDDDDDVANDLIARLKEYERYKLAAKDLKQRSWLHRDVFTRGSFVEEELEEKPVKKEADADGNYDVDTFELIKAFYDIVNKAPKGEVNHKVLSERVSVTERIYEVLDHLRRSESVLFSDLFAGDVKKIDLVVTFLAILEMGKLKMIKVYQTGSFEPIRVQRKVEVEDGESLMQQENLEELEDYK